MPQEIVDAIADVACGVEPEQARSGRIEPDDLAVGVEDDAAIADGARALANLAQQPVVLLLAIARPRLDAIRTGDDLGPEPASLEQGDRASAEQDAIQQEEVAQRISSTAGAVYRALSRVRCALLECVEKQLAKGDAA